MHDLVLGTIYKSYMSDQSPFCKRAKLSRLCSYNGGLWQDFNQFLEFALWSRNHGIWWKLGESDKSFFLYALKILQKLNPCRTLSFKNEKQPY